MEFKVGDIIKRTDSGLSDWIENSTITKIDEEKVWVKTREGREDWFALSHLVNGSVIAIKKGDKEKPVDKHIVVEDSCNNSKGIYNSYDGAVDQAKSLSEKVIVYRMVKVATVQSERKVVKVRPEKKKKVGKR